VSDSAFEFTLPDVDATDALGRGLAESFLRAGMPGRPGDPEAHGHGAVLHLQGELGAGKSTCARSLLRALGVTGLIRSPTFTLVESYPLGAMTCVHVDLYRVAGAAQVDELGLRDMLRPDRLLLIEWPEKGGNAVPAADVELRLDYAPAGRVVHGVARTPYGRTWLDNLRIDTR